LAACAARVFADGGHRLVADDERDNAAKGGEMRRRMVQMLDGRVACPDMRNGNVDVEICYRCPRLRAFYDEESGTRVVCAVPWWSRNALRRREHR
jgi:hypothetical protein